MGRGLVALGLMSGALACALLGAIGRDALGPLALLSTSEHLVGETADLESRLSGLSTELAAARKASSEYSGRLIKTLIDARVEILRTNSDLLRQRLDAIRVGARPNIVVVAAAPNPSRGSEIAKQIASTTREIEVQEAESAKYSGGLVKAIADSGVATGRLTLAMLQLEQTKAELGIAWMPAPVGETSSESVPRVQPSSHAANTDTAAVKPIKLVPAVTGKRYVESDWKAGTYQDAIFFDINWDTSKLPRPTRAVKGILVLADVFGEARFRIKVTIDDAMKPGTPLRQASLGFRYNKFNEDHQWVRATELTNMTFSFEASDVLYADGTKEKLPATLAESSGQP